MISNPQHANRVGRAHRWGAVTFLGGGAVTAAALIAMAAAPAANADESTDIVQTLSTLTNETNTDLMKADNYLTEVQTGLSNLSGSTLAKDEVAQALSIQHLTVENDNLSLATEQYVLAHGNSFDVGIVKFLGDIVDQGEYLAAEYSLNVDHALYTDLGGSTSMASDPTAFAESAAVLAHPAATSFLGELGAMAGAALGDLAWDYGKELLLAAFTL